MKFEDMEISDFENLNLKPLRHKRIAKGIIGAGEVYIFRSFGSPWFSKEKPSDRDYKTIKVDNFQDITEEQFLNTLMLSDKTTSKYIWLQKYLRGEVSGKYSEENDENLIKMSVRKAVADKEEKINKLKEKITIMSDEIAEIRDENKRLKEEIKKYEKVKKAIKDIQEIDL